MSKEDGLTDLTEKAKCDLFNYSLEAIPPRPSLVDPTSACGMRNAKDSATGDTFIHAQSYLRD
ncbi:hypothetical protein Daesc_008300 [Daldinia eschscholtzii]|uniref:Uncharacterized protein n=1 Tax=Daldinia eschscholtzii TaxID=292717 RepID=A0AAX6MC66_9PEZI